jgi:DNA-binding MarR family transcriptional regulator
MHANQIASLENNLTRLSQLIPDLPTSELLLVRLVRNLAQDLGTMLEQQVRPHGLGEGEFRVLSALYSQPQGTAHPGDLCVRTTQSPANMSRITDALVEQALITRLHSPDDRRKLVLSITDKGVQLVRRVLPEMFAPLRHLCGHLSAQDQQRLIGQLKECLIRMEADSGGEGTEAGA